MYWIAFGAILYFSICNNKIPLYSVWWAPWAISRLINTIWVINPSFFLARWCICSWVPRVALGISTQLCHAWRGLPFSDHHRLFGFLSPHFFMVGGRGKEKTYWVAGSRKKNTVNKNWVSSTISWAEIWTSALTVYVSLPGRPEDPLATLHFSCH